MLVGWRLGDEHPLSWTNLSFAGVLSLWVSWLQSSQRSCPFRSSGSGLVCVPASPSSIKKCFSYSFPSLSVGFHLSTRGTSLSVTLPQFCRAERKKDLDRLCALQLCLLFPIPTSVSEWTPSQDSHRSFLHVHNKFYEASLVAQLVKYLPGLWETWVRSLGWEDLLEKGTATLSSILAWRIPQTI